MLGMKRSTNLNEFADEINQSSEIKCWQSNPGGRFVETKHVLFWPEEPDAAVFVPVRFHSLEALESVAENAGSGIQELRLVRDNSRGLSATLKIPFDKQIMSSSLNFEA